MKLTSVAVQPAVTAASQEPTEAAVTSPGTAHTQVRPALGSSGVSTPGRPAAAVMLPVITGAGASWMVSARALSLKPTWTRTLATS